MSRSNYDKPFYVEVGTSVTAVRCASDGYVVAMYDHVRTGSWAIDAAERICDRLNAEIKAVAVNAVAMRHAMIGIKSIAESFINAYDDEIDRVMSKFVSMCDEALAEPPRNCDVGMVDEQYERYKATGEVFHTLTLENALAWAQMPYEARKDDGKHE